MIYESRDALQLEAALLFEYEMMRIKTYFRQPDLMFHANDFRVGDCLELGLDGCRTCARETEPPRRRQFAVPQAGYFPARRLVPLRRGGFRARERAQSSHPPGCWSGVVSVVRSHGQGYLHQCRHCGLH